MDSPKSNFEEKEDILRLTKLLEESMQEAHGLRSRLQVSEKCVQDYEAELEALQQDAFKKDQLHAAAIREIEEEKSNAVKDAEERVENWEQEYQVLSEKLATVQKELEEKSVNTENLTKEKNETAALYIELQETMEALTMSTAACNQHKEFISVLQDEKRELSQRVEILEESLEYYKENLSILKSQLSAQTEDFKELQEQLAVTQSELMTLKATPDMKARGNSLFAEVEDNRLQMAKDYKMMLAKFSFMKKDYTVKCSEIAKLTKENRILLDRVEVAEREAKKYYRAFVENYDIRIKELEMTISQLKNDVKPVYLNGNDQILKFAELTFVNSRKEILSLREEMEMRSALRLNEAAELLETRGELAQARGELRRLSSKIMELTTTLNGRGIAQPSSAVSEPSKEKETVDIDMLERNATSTFCALSKQKPREVVFAEELLHDKFNPRKRVGKKAQEDPRAEEMKVPQAMDVTATILKETTNSMEVADVSSQDGSKDADMDAEHPEMLDGEVVCEQDVSLGNSSEAKEGTRDFDSSMQEEQSIRKEGIADIVTQLENDDFLAPLILSPCSAGYLDHEDEKKIESMLDVTLEPSPSDGKNVLKKRTARFTSVRQSDMSICDVSGLSSGSPSEARCFDSFKCEQMSSSILKVRSNSYPMENSPEKLTKEVSFDKEVLEMVISDTDNSGVKEKEEDDANKENSADVTVENNGEEKKPARRRPRPKQTQPIIYMVT